MTLPSLRIERDDLTSAQILSLLQFHLDQMHRWSPPESIHAMPAEMLRAADVDFFSAWTAEDLAGCGAIRMIAPHHAELKSMRVDPRFLRQGVGEAILLHLLQEARARGCKRVSLETGRPAPFHAAHALYRKHGFAECPPFGNYLPDDFSLCMTRIL
ncbi:GNAT family N-acetyltransferase [Novosphingobium sp. 9]|uniref:GNAT family N-acetyltransferase n=1 Tax=Novosphingobium sp. 9 TaxID=2025349 RepID=UPI0021B64A78|nr:GNAT family N-acetyltransferase [Novosphingobium sp. 9]